MSSTRRWLLGLVLLATPLRATPEADLLERYRGAVVRVEVVLETKLNMGGQGQEQESRMDILGTVVDPSGLVMIWNSHISSSRLEELMAETGRGEGFQVEMRPTGFQVSFEERDLELPAFLAGSDSNLDLAFLQLEGEIPDDLVAVDFTEGREPVVGESVLALNRLGRSFGLAPYLETGVVTGSLQTPRSAWITSGDLSGLGLPVFNHRGRPVGVLSTVFAGAVSETGQDAAGGFGRYLRTALQGQGAMGPIGVFVLPAGRVAAVIELAMAQAAELLEREPISPPEPRP